MPRGGTFQQSYNAQVAVDADTQLIVAQEVGQSASDARQLEPMVEQTQANTGLVPVQLSADSGYLCKEDIEKVEAKGVECFVPLIGFAFLGPGHGCHEDEKQGRPAK